jgi:hypothetical protein
MDSEVTEVTESDEGIRRLTEEQQEYVLRKIAAFYRMRDIVDSFRGEFPECKLTEHELYNRIRYMAQDRKANKWQKRIEEYREELRNRPMNSFAIGNRFDRVRILQKLIDFAADPHLRRIIWYPLRRDPNGTLHYDKMEVWEPDYRAVFGAMRLLHEEMGKKK